MGTVIRPAAFARGKGFAPLSPASRRVFARRIRRFDFGFAALVVAVMAMAWILALAGTAFTVRMFLILCFATLAGRARRVGVPASRPVRVRGLR